MKVLPMTFEITSTRVSKSLKTWCKISRFGHPPPNTDDTCRRGGQARARVARGASIAATLLGGRKRRLADVERTKGRERCAAREWRVDPELVRGEGHIRERGVLDGRPGGDGTDGVVHCRGRDLRAGL